MATPRILAIDDVHIEARRALRDPTVTFYRDLLGLEQLDEAAPSDRLVFRGAVRSGPRLRVNLIEEPLDESMRRDALLLVDDLARMAGLFAEQRMEIQWSRGWSYYDRRILVQDPSGNRLELVSAHGW